tara:strand:- start:558 stop:3725 length:3168 start_codon:yes stop_codon:yes gene_type:complete
MAVTLITAFISTIAVTASAFPRPYQRATYVDLGGTAWTVANSTMTTPVAATVPGVVHTDLLAAGVITEPTNGSNVELQRWIALSNWTYSRTFEVTPAMLAKRVVQLVSLGIDTVAAVSINDHEILHTDNMFQRHIVNLQPTKVLEAGTNTIVVEFASKVIEATKRFEECDPTTSIICPNVTKNPVQHPFQNVGYLRTEPSSFSWDWGPAYAPVGLFRPIYLQAFDSAVVRDITVITTPYAVSDTAIIADRIAANPDPADTFASNDTSEEAAIARAFKRTDRELDTTTWDVALSVYVDVGVLPVGTKTNSSGVAAAWSKGTVVATFPSPDGHVIKYTKATLASGDGGLTKVDVNFQGIKGVDTWWPNGYGAHTLYTVTATWVPDCADAPGPACALPSKPFETPYPLLDDVIKGGNGSLSVRFGFRTVELVQNKLPGGKSYYFAVNGVPIPVKGSNWIPADSFESRVSRNLPGTTRLAPLFVALVTSHQNMIRNWGGGIYQRDTFYDLADENGIMIWEDMMWACDSYAVPPSYLASAAKEVRDNVRRMQPHPSIAIWAGNNEDERDGGGLSYAPNTPKNSSKNTEAYSLLTFITAIGNITAIDTSRPTSGSSPSCGNETAAYPGSWCFPAYGWGSEFYGDMHNYLYDLDNWDDTLYKSPRFMSEFGLQSWPSALTMGSVFPAEMWSYSSAMSEERNHHPNGQQEMLQQVAMHFHLVEACDPKQANNCPPSTMYAGWALQLWLTQLNQAEGYKHEIEHFRRIRTDCSENVPGCNMGRMFWQTNDIWQGASWAAIDYVGRYKMVQYLAARAYAPVLASATGNLDHNDFTAVVINDKVGPADGIANGTLVFRMYTWADGPIPGGEWSVPVNTPPASAVTVATSTFQEMLHKGKCEDASKCFLTLKLLNASGAVLSRNHLMLAPFFDVTTMRDPRLAITSVSPVTDPVAAGAFTAIESATSGAFHVTIATKATAAWVWLETQYTGRWSDNALLMTVDRPNVTLTWFADAQKSSHVTAAMLMKSLNGGRWSPCPRCPSKSSIKPNSGAFWSIADTSNEYITY